MSSNKQTRAITTVSQHRIGLFPPVKQIQKRGEDVVVENAHGICRLKACRITQVHAGIMEALFACAFKVARTDDGQIGVLISFPEVMRTLGLSARNGTWLRKHLDDLQEQMVDAEVNGLRVSSKIVRKIKQSVETFQMPGNALPGRLHWVIFEAEFSKFYLNDLGVDWSEHLPTLTQMSGPAQGVARYCLTHKRVAGERITDVLERLGQKWVGANARKMKQQSVRAVTEDAELFGEIGIQIELGKTIEERRLHYEKAANDDKKSPGERVDVRILPAGRLFE